MAWLLDTIRATVFAPDIKALSLPNWETLAGARRLQMTTPAPGMQLEIGLYRGYRLSLWEGPGRADLIAAAPFDTLPMTRPASLGDLSQFSTEFLELTKRWLSNNTSDIRRIALYCTIWEGAQSIDDAINTLLPKIPSFKKQPGEKILDFMLQINRPRTSAVDPQKEINRLVQWSARMVQLVTVPSAPWEPQPPIIPYPRAQADIDINTAEGTEIQNSLIPGYFDEMSSLMLEIVERGDTP